MQPIEVVLKRQLEALERQREIGRQLAGKMEHASAAAIDPVHPDAEGLQRRRHRRRCEHDCPIDPR